MYEKPDTNSREHGTVTQIFVISLSAIILILLGISPQLSEDLRNLPQSFHGNQGTPHYEPLSENTRELHTTAGIPVPVVHLALARTVNGTVEHGECSGTVVAATVILTAAHCLHNTTGQPIASPMQYRNSHGVIVRPFGTCTLGDPIFPEGNTPSVIPHDVALLPVLSCSNPAGIQSTTLRRIGDRTGTMFPTPWAAASWWDAPNRKVEAFGYPQTDQNGQLTDSDQLWQLDTTPTASPYRSWTAIGPGMRSWRGTMTPGCSGGPVLRWKGNRWQLVSIISRQEIYATTGEWTSMSGPPLTAKTLHTIRNIS